MDTSMTLGTMIKNTDKRLFFNSEKAKICPVCTKPFKRMVSHLKNVHDKHEVYISRLSPQMVENVRNGKILAIKYIKNKSSQYLRSTCAFCEKTWDFMPHYWSDHIRSHTGGKIIFYYNEKK